MVAWQVVPSFPGNSDVHHVPCAKTNLQLSCSPKRRRLKSLHLVLHILLMRVRRMSEVHLGSDMLLQGLPLSEVRRALCMLGDKPFPLEVVAVVSTRRQACWLLPTDSVPASDQGK